MKWKKEQAQKNLYEIQSVAVLILVGTAYEFVYVFRNNS